MAVTHSYALSSRAAGFSIFELMIVLMLIAILLALATPSFRDFTRSNQVTSTNNDLVTALNLARSEALRRSTGVTVCSSTDGTSCGSAADWGSGWIVFEDAAGTGAVASADKVVQKWSATNNGIQVVTTSANIQYQPTGTAASSAAIDVSFDSCKGQRKRHIQVSAVGSITTQLQSCS
jgi:type IV fimbrial biogenesis protein FimT